MNRSNNGFGPVLIVIGVVLMVLVLATGSKGATRLPPQCYEGNMLQTCQERGHWMTVRGKRVFSITDAHVIGQAHASALGWQRLRNHSSPWFCMSSGGADSNGQWIRQYDCNQSQNQQFNIYTSNGGWALGVGNTHGRCMNNRYGDVSQGSIQIMYDCNGQWNEVYGLVANGQNPGGWLGFIIRANSGTVVNGVPFFSNYAVDGYHYNFQGAPVALYPITWSGAQTWGATG